MDELSAWAKRCFENLTTKDQPSSDDMWHAFVNANAVAYRVKHSKRLIQRHHSHRTDVAQLLDDVYQALCDDHGGITPGELLDMWENRRCDSLLDIAAGTPEEKKTMIMICDRWKDIKSVEKEFWAFGSCDKGDRIHLVEYISEERVSQIEQCLRDWLQRRRDSPPYQYQS